MPLDPKKEDYDQKYVMNCRSQMPPFYCLDILFKYRMFDHACKYLFYRREYNELFTLIRFEYNENKK